MFPIAPTRPSSPRPARIPTTDEARLNPWLLWHLERPAERAVLSVADLAECQCPDLCDRDHDND